MKPFGDRLREAMQGEPLRLTRAKWLEVRRSVGPPSRVDVLRYGAIGHFGGTPVIIIEEDE